MDDDFSELQRLLRLKRHEAPPLDYLEDFMAEFHQRQRAELLRRPIWRLALDRLEGAWPVFPAARYAYAGSCAAALVTAGLISVRILSVPAGGLTAANAVSPQEAPKIAAVNPPPSSQQQATAPRGFNVASRTSAPPARIDFRAQRPTFAISSDLDFDARPAAAPAVSQPRYLLDAQPVSYEYEPPFSF